MKPYGYLLEDWAWLIQKFDRNLRGWTYRWLTLGGRYILIQYVLQQLATYLMHLFIISAYISSKIRSIMAHFLWSGVGRKNKYHLIAWDTIVNTKELRGWGIFHSALLVYHYLLNHCDGTYLERVSGHRLSQQNMIYTG